MPNRELQVEIERGAEYGNFELNMVCLTRAIEAMASQALQQQVSFPDNFGALVCCEIKKLRECYKHKDDNGVDHHNYLAAARRIGHHWTPAS